VAGDLGRHGGEAGGVIGAQEWESASHAFRVARHLPLAEQNIPSRSPQSPAYMKTPHIITSVLIAVALPLGAPAQALSPDELVIEAVVDGPAFFHLRAEGVYWENGDNAKPGKWSGLDEPTYINGVAWMPKWNRSKDYKGRDKTQLHRISFGTIDVEFELLAVTKNRGESGIDHRTRVATKREGNDFVVTIPDPEPEARWYKFVLRKKAKK